MYKISYLKIVMAIAFVLIVVSAGYAWWKNLNNVNKLKNPSNTSIQRLTTNTQETHKNNISNWKIYQNEKYGFEIKYPNSWISSKGRGLYSSTDLFSFSTTHGYRVIFGINEFPPSQDDQSMEEYRRAYSKGNLKSQQHDILIGSEFGLETKSSHMTLVHWVTHASV